MSPLLLLALAAAPPALADGATTYASYCATCHGPAGLGDGPASAALVPAPASLAGPDFWDAQTDAAVKKVIKEGGAASGRSPVMPAWGTSLTDGQIDELIAYLKTLPAG